MAFSIIHSPDAFALTKAGRMIYQFAGNARTISAGAKAVNEIAFTKCPEGTRFTLTWNGRSYTYVARTKPLQANEFPAGDGSAAYVDKLLTYFKSRFEIREDFVVSRSQVGSPALLQTLLLTAKQPGPSFNATAFTSIDTAFTSGVAVNNTTPGVLAQVHNPYQVYIEVWLETPDGTSFERKFEGTADTDESGLATFDVGNVLHDQLSIDWPSFGLAATNLNPHSARRYYIGYAEAVDSPLQIGNVTESEPLRAYMGGADYVNRAGEGFPLLSFIQTAAPAEDFALRFGPLTRYVLPQEPQFISFLNTRAAIANLVLEVLVTYDNDQEEIRTDLLPPFAWPLGTKITLPVGAQQLGLVLQENGVSIREYSIRLRQDGTDNYFSTSYRYILNYTYQQYARFIAYESSLGVIDTVATFGKGSTELERFYEEAEQFLVTGYNLTDGQFVDYDVTIQRQLDVTTGYRDEAELQRWNDLYRSPHRVLIEHHLPLPISIVAKSIQQGKDGDNQFAHKFQLVYSFKDAFFTGEQTLEVFDPLPPPNFTPAGGQLVLQQPQVTYAYDVTVPQTARDLTPEVVVEAKQAFAWGNHADVGYINEQKGATLYTPKAFSDQIIQAANAAVGTQLMAVDSQTKSLRVAAPEEVQELAHPNSTLDVDKIFLRNPDQVTDSDVYDILVRTQGDKQQRLIDVATLAKLLKPLLGSITTPTDPTTPGTLVVKVVSYDPATGLLTVAGSGVTTAIEFKINGLRDWSSTPTFTIPDYQRDGSVVFAVQARSGTMNATVNFTPFVVQTNWPGAVVITEDVNSHGVIVETEGLGSPQGITVSVARADGVIESGTAYGEVWRSGTARLMKTTTDPKYKLSLFFFPGPGGPGLTPGYAYTFTFTNVQSGAKKMYQRVFPAGGANTNRVPLSEASNPTSPTTPTNPTPVDVVTPSTTKNARYQLVDNPRKVQVEMESTDQIEYQAGVANGPSYGEAVLPAWPDAWNAAPVTADLGAGLKRYLIEHPVSPADTVWSIIRTRSQANPSDTLVIPTRGAFPFGWRKLRVNALIAQPCVGTDSAKLWWQISRYENGYAVFTPTIGWQRPNNMHWYWWLGNKYMAVWRDSVPAEIRVAIGTYQRVLRYEHQRDSLAETTEWDATQYGQPAVHYLYAKPQS